jgi:hypothetical protein
MKPINIEAPQFSVHHRAEPASLRVVTPGFGTSTISTSNFAIRAG